MKSEGWGFGGRHGSTRELHRESTEVRGDDELEPHDWPTGTPAPHFPRAFPRQATQRELLERPFVGVKDGTRRCWCGRPIKESTNRCLSEHFPEGL